MLTLEFRDFGDGTELILTHEHFVSEESRTNHGEGWASIMEKLGRVLAG